MREYFNSQSMELFFLIRGQIIFVQLQPLLYHYLIFFQKLLYEQDLLRILSIIKDDSLVIGVPSRDCKIINLVKVRSAISSFSELNIGCNRSLDFCSASLFCFFKIYNFLLSSPIVLPTHNGDL